MNHARRMNGDVPSIIELRVIRCLIKKPGKSVQPEICNLYATQGLPVARTLNVDITGAFSDLSGLHWVSRLDDRRKCEDF
jgi:hypothetical protein